MEALQGANVPGADARCLADGTSSIGAFLRVAKPDDDEDDLYFEINLPSVDEGVDPIDSLQTLVDLWGGCDFTSIEEYNRKRWSMSIQTRQTPTVSFALKDGRDLRSGKDP